jgi:HEAT repeat protein
MRHHADKSGRFGLVLLLLGWSAVTAPAQIHAPDDPVEALRQALRIPVRDALNKVELDFRQANLERQVKALRTLGQLARALALQEWRDLDRDPGVAGVDQVVRKQVADRFTDGIRKVLQQGDQTSQLAAITLIGQMGTNVRDLEEVSGFARRFGPDLARLVEGRNLTLAAAAARALGAIHPDAKVAAQALNLAAGHFADATPDEKKAAAEGLLGLMRGVSQLARGRTTTGVDVTHEDIVTMGEAVIPTARRGLRDEDAVVRRLCTEAIRAGAAALSEMVVDPRPASDFPPSGRPLSREERDSIEAYRREVEEEMATVRPLATALGDAAADVAERLRDSDREVRIQAARALEEMAISRRRMNARVSSVPRLEPEKDSRLGPDAEPEPGLRPVLVALPRVLPEPRFVLAADADLPKDANPLSAGLQGVLNDLAAALADPSWRVRLAAIEAIEVYGSAAIPVAAAVIDTLPDCNPFVRWAAARTLGNMGLTDGTAPAVAALVRLLEDTDLSIRLAAAEALGDFGALAASAVPALIPFVNHDDVEMRIRAMQTLVEIGPLAAAAVPAVTEALANSDSRVRLAAAATLSEFGPAARSAIPALLKALDDQNAEVRQAASEALLSISP